MKIENVGVPLKDWDVQINRGILTGFNEAFIIDEETKAKLILQSPESAEIIRPIFRGRDIKKFDAKFAGQWIINSHNGIKVIGLQKVNVEENYPSIYNHLNKFRNQLEVRQDKGEHWTNLRNCAYLDDLNNREKIIWIELTDHPNFYFDNEYYYLNNTVFFMTGSRLKYLTAFLNSKLCEWYFDKIAATSGVGTRRWIKIYVEQIRIPINIDSGLELEIESLVDKIQGLKKMNKYTKDLEEQIDQIMIDLFHLTEEEREYVLSAEL